MIPILSAAIRDGDVAKALSIIEKLPKAEREQFEIAAHEADLLGRLGRHELELQILHRLIEREPANPSLHLSVANALKSLGRSAEAVDAVQRALAFRPHYGKAWWLLADLKTYVFGEAEMAAMQSALVGSGNSADRQNLHFALGCAFEQRSEPATAFAHFDSGNAMLASALPAAAMTVTGRVDRAISTFTPAFFDFRENFGVDSSAPIFIVGLNRSGSTLVEQIIGNHPAIEATGELPVIAQLFRSVGLDQSLPGNDPLAKLSTIDRERARALGAEYLERASHYRLSDKPRFIDKMPANWLHIGFIRMILPNARIIDARRHPMAAGFSNFRQNYGEGATWSFSLDAIGKYYRDYLRLMQHFNRVLPGKIHRIINEHLIEDIEPEVRRLIDHVGVDFDPACLDFHRSGRPVRSASAEQVRRPINSEGVDKWRAFEPWLGPLKEALGPALENWQE